MLTAIVFVIILGILIFVHELGHFLTAIWSGIRAEEFGFGFPPRIIGIQRYSGTKVEKVSEDMTVETTITDIPQGKNEIILEKTEKVIKEIDKIESVKKWRWIRGRYDGDQESEIEEHEEKQKFGSALEYPKKP